MKSQSDRLSCFNCDEGELITVVEDFEVELPDAQRLVVPNLQIRRCNACGEDTLPAASSRAVDEAIDEFQETIPAEIVRRFLEQFELTQSDAAEALGLGGKTVHRWAKGTQRVSRSMGFFIRALMAHPEAFEWIRERKWRERRAIAPKPEGAGWAQAMEVRFAATFSRMKSPSPPAPAPKFNAARGLMEAIHK